MDGSFFFWVSVAVAVFLLPVVIIGAAKGRQKQAFDDASKRLFPKAVEVMQAFFREAGITVPNDVDSLIKPMSGDFGACYFSCLLTETTLRALHLEQHLNHAEIRLFFSLSLDEFIHIRLHLSPKKWPIRAPLDAVDFGLLRSMPHPREYFLDGSFALISYDGTQARALALPHLAPSDVVSGTHANTSTNQQYDEKTVLSVVPSIFQQALTSGIDGTVASDMWLRVKERSVDISLSAWHNHESALSPDEIGSGLTHLVKIIKIAATE